MYVERSYNSSTMMIVKYDNMYVLQIFSNFRIMWLFHLNCQRDLVACSMLLATLTWDANCLPMISETVDGHSKKLQVEDCWPFWIQKVEDFLTRSTEILTLGEM